MADYYSFLAILFVSMLLISFSDAQKAEEDDKRKVVTYSYGYDVGSHYQNEAKDSNNVVRGEYGWMGPDGIYREYNYTADKYGFRINRRRSRGRDRFTQPPIAGQQPAVRPTPQYVRTTPQPLEGRTAIPVGAFRPYGLGTTQVPLDGGSRPIGQATTSSGSASTTVSSTAEPSGILEGRQEYVPDYGAGGDGGTGTSGENGIEAHASEHANATLAGPPAPVNGGFASASSYSQDGSSDAKSDVDKNHASAHAEGSKSSSQAAATSSVLTTSASSNVATGTVPNLSVGSGANADGISGTGAPEYGVPEYGVPEDEVPEYGAPGSGAQGSGTPGSGTQGSGTPGSGTQGSGTPGSGTQGSGTPGSGTQGSGTPGSGTPGPVNQGTGVLGSGAPGTGTQGSGIPGSGTQGSGIPASGTTGVSGSGTIGYRGPGSASSAKALPDDFSGGNTGNHPPTGTQSTEFSTTQTPTSRRPFALPYPPIVYNFSSSSGSGIPTRRPSPINPTYPPKPNPTVVVPPVEGYKPQSYGPTFPEGRDTTGDQSCNVPNFPTNQKPSGISREEQQTPDGKLIGKYKLTFPLGYVLEISYTAYQDPSLAGSEPHDRQHGPNSCK